MTLSIRAHLRSLAFAAALLISGLAPAQLVYENTSSPVTAGYSQPLASNPVFGDSLSLTGGGLLGLFEFSIFNSSSGGNTGSILTGTMTINFYDNTVAYTGGVLANPLLGTANVNLNFGGGLNPGFFSLQTVDLSSSNINLPTEILVTQQFTMTSGTSLRVGIVLLSDPPIGTSPNTVYLKSASTAEGLYTFAGNPGQFAYSVSIVPEPTTLSLVGLALTVGWLRRRAVA